MFYFSFLFLEILGYKQLLIFQKLQTLPIIVFAFYKIRLLIVHISFDLYLYFLVRVC